MSELEDVFSAGTRPIDSHDSRQSSIMIPTNEDWCMLVEVDSVSNGTVLAHKIWDQAEPPTQFSARMVYDGGSADTPPDTALAAGDITKMFREPGDPANYIIFVPAGLKLLFVRDINGISGQEIEYDDSGNEVVPPGSQVLTMRGIDPPDRYHGGPPFFSGRVYLGVKSASEYLVALPGFGPPDNTFSESVAGITIEVKTDRSGKIAEIDAT